MSDDHDDPDVTLEEPRAKSRKDKLKELAKRARKREEGNGEQRPKRSRRAAEGADEGDAQGQHTRGEALGGEEDLPSEDIAEEDADKEFIDDDGAQPASGGEDDHDHDAHINAAPEAEEGDEDEIDRLLKQGKRKKKEVDYKQLEKDTLNMIAKMDAAFEDDYELVCRNNGVMLAKDANGSLMKDPEGNYRTAGPPGLALPNKEPALHKLKLVKDMQHFLAQRKYHEPFLAHGGMGVLKSWLEPYPGGALPNVKVRSAVLKVLQTLPIDTAKEDVKEQLKRSQLGRNVMFLMKCPDETHENRHLAKELVHRWSRPIFYDAGNEEAKKRAQRQLLEEARRQSLLQRQAKEQEGAVNKREERQKAMRIHALIPQGSKLDYVVNPTTLKAQSDEVLKPRGSQRDDQLTKRLREQQRRNKATSARAMKPSIEGRDIILRN